MWFAVKVKKSIGLFIIMFFMFCTVFFVRMDTVTVKADITDKSKTDTLTEIVYVTVKVNRNCIAMDTLPYIAGNRTMVPLRFVSQALGAEVEWVGEERKIIITDVDNVIEMWIGSSVFLVNGEAKTMDTAPQLNEDNRTMVPVRFVTENLGCNVEWHEPTYSVLLTKEDAAVPAAFIDNRSYTDDDIIWLSRIITVEGRGLPLDGKVAIGNVVLNRKKSSSFPNTIHDVIFQIDVHVQFPPAHKEGFRELEASGSSVIAAKMALEGINNISSCLFFNNAPFKSKSESDLYRIIEGEYFYY
jgi:N-acetylmuramoyl-L-alanine amidase